MTKVQPAPRSGVLTEEQLGNVYVQVLHNISVRAVSTDAERQAMADAVREFYDLATDAIRPRRAVGLLTFLDRPMI
jgi:hypothetical protein